MGIGVSSGAYYDSEFHQQAGWESNFDNNEVGPDEQTEPQPAKVIPVSERDHKLGGLFGSTQGSDPDAGLSTPGFSGVPSSELGRLMRQQSNIVDHNLPDRSTSEPTGVESSHPMDPMLAAQYYHNLADSGAVRQAIGHALDYEERASPEQWEIYERAVNNPNEHGLTARRYNEDVPLAGRPTGHEEYHSIEDLAQHPDVQALFRGNQQMQREMDEEHEATLQNKKDAFNNTDEVKEKGPVKLTKDPEFEGRAGKYLFQTDAGHLGTVSTSLRKDGKEIRIHGLYGLTGDPNEYGKSEMKALFKLIADEYPTADYISGFRVSGARAETGYGAAEASMRIPGRGMSAK